jgi:P-loop Domain of unknown function (DUF2791)
MTVVDRVSTVRALEALRSGVPNSAAVRVLGCNQPHVDIRFRDSLRDIEASIAREEQLPGILVAGDFGTGKSHLLEYLEQVGLEHNFVTSRVVISKETPLYDAGKVFRAAIESAKVPARAGMAIPEIAGSLNQFTGAYSRLFTWTADPTSGMASLFAATLRLHERLSNDPDTVEQIEQFWAGDPLPIKVVRDGLRSIGQLVAFPVKAVKARDLTEQRWAFATRLMMGAGYSGWLLLIDELELIGRYSLLQRARSYAELARWMGRIDGDALPGLFAVGAITGDFAAEVLVNREDRDKVGSKLRDRGTDDFLTLAAQAEAGMRIIEREPIRLEAPTFHLLRDTHDKLRNLHGAGYEWSPPEIPWEERGPHDAHAVLHSSMDKRVGHTAPVSRSTAADAGGAPDALVSGGPGAPGGSGPAVSR